LWQSLLVAAVAFVQITPKERTGTFVLQVTDQPSAIGDFDSLNVTVSEVKIHKASETNNETNETGEWITLEPLNRTFDLTKLRERNVTTIVNKSVETGKYTQVRFIVESAGGIVNGSMVNVSVPSGMLKIVIKPNKQRMPPNLEAVPQSTLELSHTCFTP
jgi:hypothetical protein